MKYSTVSVLFFIFTIALVCDAGTVRQEVPPQDGPIINQVTGAGSSASTISKSTTEVTTADGRTIMPGSSEEQTMDDKELREEILKQMLIMMKQRQ